MLQESPERGFLPASGLLTHMQPPAEVHGRVRVDTGVRAGDHVSVFYDPMIAKLIVWGEDRRKALKALAHALESFQIGGVPTNIPFCHRCVRISSQNVTAHACIRDRHRS